MTTSSAELTRCEVEARILVVDDEAEIAMLVADSLREADPAWEVVMETDPAQALERLTDESFDCLITDLVMPGLGGLGLARKAKAADDTLAVIAITGCGTLESSIEAMRVGFSDFIQKPFNLDLIRQAVSRTLSARRRQQQCRHRFAELAEAKTDLEQANAQMAQKLDIASHDLVLSNRRMARQMEDLAQAADVARSLMGIIELEDLLGLCAEILGDRVPCATSTVALYEASENAVGLLVRAYPDADDPPALCWLREPVHAGVMCRAAQASKSIHIDDLSRSNLVHEQEKELWREGRLLVVPVPCQHGIVAAAVLHRHADDEDFSAQDVKHLSELAKVMGPAIQTARLHHRQRCQVYTALELVADAVETRNPYLKGHSARVLAYAMHIGTALELPQSQIGAIQIAARLHDVGRIVIPEEAINHPGPLSEEQWNVVRQHPGAAADFLRPLDFFGEVGEVIRSHHESYDGTGYPNLKAGEEIPLVARVLAVADSFDSMTSDRPYRDALSIDEARDQIRRLAGQQYDPQVAEALLGVPIELLTQIHDTAR